MTTGLVSWGFRGSCGRVSARDFGGRGEQLPHREQLLLQTRPGGDPVPGDVSGRHGFLQDGEGVPDRAVQGQAGVVQQDQVQPVAPELLAVVADLPAHVVRGKAVPGAGLVVGGDSGVHGVGSSGRVEVAGLRGDPKGRESGQSWGEQGLRLAGGVVRGGVDPLRAREAAARAAASGIARHR